MMLFTLQRLGNTSDIYQKTFHQSLSFVAFFIFDFGKHYQERM